MAINPSEKVSNKYLDVTYADKPFTDYPALLTEHLTRQYKMKKNSKLLHYALKAASTINQPTNQPPKQMPRRNER